MTQNETMPKPEPESNNIQGMFGRIAPRYDLLNHILSFGLDFYWWHEMAKMAVAAPGAKILDVAAGTGDSTLALFKRGASVVMSDFALPMLALGRNKLNRNTEKKSILGSVGADAHGLPFRSASFDAVTISYGIRNVQKRGLAYSEFWRVLKPRGRLVILEFSRPRQAWLKWIYNLYNRFVIPRIGGWISGDKTAYTYLPESISSFPNQTELAQELKEAGFTNVGWQSLSFGIVALHHAEKPLLDTEYHLVLAKQ